MAKKAVCVGINDYPYGSGNDLNGCVNDANGWADLLINNFGFASADVKVLLDAKATKANIMAALEGMVKGAKSGDILVFTNSSHGTYVADTSGDEEKYDEAICPYDCDDDQLIVDDDLRNLFATLKDGVNLTVILDSCFSGTATRAAKGKTPDDRRRRFLSPALMGRPILKNPWKAKAKGKAMNPELKMKEVLLSGCSDKQYSSDAIIDGAYHGAMSYYALKAIKDMNCKITYNQLHSQIEYTLTEEYDQTPQLEGKSKNKKKQLFSS
jgi:metacaspase-1